jgi:CRP/FNR family transcriptional regulator, dissimilatory nitrate respiration regulator
LPAHLPGEYIPVMDKAPSMPPELAQRGRRRAVKAATILFFQDERAESCFFLERGEIALRRLSRAGDEVEIGRVGPGEWFGEVILFASGDYPAQAVAVSDCELLEFSREAALSANTPGGQRFFLNLLARKCLTLNRRIEELTIMDARERLARYVLGLCPGFKKGCPGKADDRPRRLLGTSPAEAKVDAPKACVLCLPKKKREIALELGMAPETLSRTLRQLEEEGYIKVSGSTLEVFSCAYLRKFIEEE